MFIPKNFFTFEIYIRLIKLRMEKWSLQPILNPQKKKI